jgi:hypothetical protein
VVVVLVLVVVVVVDSNGGVSTLLSTDETPHSLHVLSCLRLFLSHAVVAVGQQSTEQVSLSYRGS